MPNIKTEQYPEFLNSILEFIMEVVEAIKAAFASLKTVHGYDNPSYLPE